MTVPASGPVVGGSGAGSDPSGDTAGRRPGERAAGPPWADAIAAALADPTSIGMVFQPIVDLAQGTVVGYEALARFTGPPAATPDRWFAAADKLGLGAALEAAAIRRALGTLGTLAPERFLAVNVSPHLLHDPVLAAALLGSGSLDRVVVELTEHLPVDDLDRFSEAVARLRAAGATIALDDAGSGYAGLQQLAAVRPQIVKLDRALVDHADRDEAKLALAELLGAYAGRLDACLLVEGVERLEELGAFIRLGVPLAQGWLFGRGTAGWSELPDGMGDHVRLLGAQARQVEVVGSLVERAVTVPDGEHDVARALLSADPGLELVVVVDGHERPLEFVRRGHRGGEQPGATATTPIGMRVGQSDSLVDVATRAMTRQRAVRFDPAVCVDDVGRLLGIVPVERITLRLAVAAGRPHGPDLTGPADLHDPPLTPVSQAAARPEEIR